MIYLNKASSNIFAVSASTKATETTFYYLFRFDLIEDNKDYFIYLTRDNPTSNRSDIFTLVLPTDLGLPEGKYHYYVYESTVNGSLDYSSMVELENGKAVVPTTAMDNTNFETNDEQDYSFNPS